MNAEQRTEARQLIAMAMAYDKHELAERLSFQYLDSLFAQPTQLADSGPVVIAVYLTAEELDTLQQRLGVPAIGQLNLGMKLEQALRSLGRVQRVAP